MRRFDQERNDCPVKAPNPITHGVIWKQLLLYFAPLLASSCLQLLYNTADTIIVGRFVGKIALTAVGGSAGQIYAMVTEFVIGASGGACVILSQAYGARNRKLLDDGLHNAAALALLMGGLFTAAGIALSGTALRAAGAPAETMAGSSLYLRIAFAGLIPNALYNMGAGVLRAVGDAKRPLRFLMISSGLNIVLDLIFVAVLRMGIGGAALATVMTQTLSAALVLRTLMRTGSRDPLMPGLDLHRLRLQKKVALKMLRLGIPLGMETLMYTFSCVVLTSAVNTFGTDTVAAYAGFVRIESFYWMLEQAFAVSITTFVGQNIGARKFDRVTRVVRCVGLTGLVVATAFSAVVLLFPTAVCEMFTSDAAVLAESSLIIMPIVINAYGAATRSPAFAIINGSGNSRLNLLVAILDGMIARIGLAYILGFGVGLGSLGFWYGDALAGFMPITIGGIFYLSGKWKTNLK